MKYSLPMKVTDIEGVSYTELSPGHAGYLQHAVDFVCAEKCDVFAAAAGIVVYVKDGSRVGGSDKEKFWDKGNRVVLKHGEEYTAYEHLLPKCAVKKGQEVQQGDILGKSGNTGFSYWPHLHFEVFLDPVDDESEGTTIPVQFPELADIKLPKQRFKELYRAIPKTYLDGIAVPERPE